METWSFVFTCSVYLSMIVNLVSESPGDPATDCPMFVHEGWDLHCRCFASHSTDPSATISWNVPGGGSLLTVRNVGRQDNGKEYTCHLDWGTGSLRSRKSVTYTLHVAIGPQSVRISTNATQPFITNGTAQMTLFCQADDVFPAVNYTWAGVTCINEHHEHGTCIFIPRVPEDDGHHVSCTAYNVVSLNQRTSEPYTIQLNYPPSSPPSILGYTEGSILIGNNITVYCAVKGGKPKVLSVIFFCGDEPDKEDIVQDMLVWSSVDISLKTKHNNTVCECSAIWDPQPGFYSYITSVRLYVRERTTPRPPSETTGEMYTEQPTQTPVKTSQVTHVTTFPSSVGLRSSPQMDSSPSPQSNPGQSVPTGVIAGIVAAVVVTVIVIAAIVYVTRRQQNRSTTRNTSFKDNTQDNDFEEQINEFYISADALGLNKIRPVDDLSQSRVQDPVAQLSPHTSSDDTDKGCRVQRASKHESTMSNIENLYAEVADKDLRGSKP